jgi:hypothetical protein
LSDRYLSLIFRDFNLDHSDLIFHIFYIHFSTSQDIFLNVRLFIQDTELIVAIDELNTCQVSILASQLVLLSQSLHVLLERDNDHVEFFYFIGVLIDVFFLLFFLKVVLIELGFGLISFVDLQLEHMIVVLNSLVLFCAFVLQDLQLVLQDLDPLFQLGKVLR